MGATNQTTSDGADIDVCATVRDALEDRILVEVHANLNDHVVACEMGGQYTADTTQEIAHEVVKPVLPTGWQCGAYVSTSADVEMCPHPYSAERLILVSIDGQDVREVKIWPHCIGVVAGGLREYIDTRIVDTHDIPSTYSSWEAELAGGESDATHGSGSSSMFRGPVGVARDDDEACRYQWQSGYVQAAVRILNGPGRYSPDDYQIHAGVPFAVVAGRDATIAIAPTYETLDACDVDDPDFTYSTEGTSHDFQLIG